jgi:hypothetical protein
MKNIFTRFSKDYETFSLLFASFMLFVIFNTLLFSSWGFVSPPQVSGSPGDNIRRLSSYKGSHYAGFAEFRVNEFEFDSFGQVQLKGEPYDILLNVTKITRAYRLESGSVNKKTFYSTLVFVDFQKEPLLLRQSYKDVSSSIRKSMEYLAND